MPAAGPSPAVADANIQPPSTQDRLHSEETHPMVGDPVCAEYGGSKGVNLEKQPPILWCEHHAYGMNGSQ